MECEVAGSNPPEPCPLQLGLGVGVGVDSGVVVRVGVIMRVESGVVVRVGVGVVGVEVVVGVFRSSRD